MCQRENCSKALFPPQQLLFFSVLALKRQDLENVNHLDLKLQAKFIFMGFCHYIRSPSICSGTGARSVTSCSKFKICACSLDYKERCCHGECMKNSTHGKMENDLWFPECRGQFGRFTGKTKRRGKNRSLVVFMDFAYTEICPD